MDRIVTIFILETTDWEDFSIKLAKDYGYPNAQIHRTEAGKPYFSHAGNLHFNISTSCERSVLAFANFPIGIDWENLERKISHIAIAKRYFLQEEYQWMTEGGKNLEKERFFLLWTAKEAAVKLDGCGLYDEGLSGCQIDTQGSKSQFCHLKKQKIYLKRHRLYGGFLLTVAAYDDFVLALPVDSLKVE